jgi:hypothetical protein
MIWLCLLSLCSQVVAKQEQGRSSFFTNDPALLTTPVRFADMEISLPKDFRPLPDSLAAALEKQSTVVGRDGFLFQMLVVMVDSLGNIIALSRILEQQPDSDFTYLAQYAPYTSAGEKLKYSVRQLSMDPIVLREYRFVRLGYIVRQLFTHSSNDIYKMDFLIKGKWNKRMIHTFESVISSIRFISTNPSTPK